MTQVITEEMDVQKEWYEQAKNVKLAELPEFLTHLMNHYQHDYGTICHAIASGAIATAWAMNHEEQGGITGFQAGAIMWEFIRHWNYQNNKTGLKIVDYDNFLYPQYEDKYEKVLSPGVWKRIQKAAAENIAEADAEYIKYVEDSKQYEEDLAKFIIKFPDYPNNRAHYDHLDVGKSDDWDAYEAKVSSGFEFAPRKPYPGVNREGRVYKHWQSIVAGVIPFGFTLSKED